MKKETIALLLAGGVGSRLNILARYRAKPAIVFGGIYRIIDFTLSNVANCGIDVVGVLTQYKPQSLMEHIDHGRPWDLFGRTRLVEILPPKTGERSSDWYKGTSDAVYQNIPFLDDYEPATVLIVSGDHIYNMDYRAVIAQHHESKADVTVCLVRVPIDQAHQFGLATLGRRNRIAHWIEKPVVPKSDLASMGVYVFSADILKKSLHRAARRKGTDFAKDILPPLIRKKRVFGFVFHGYWRDVGTIEAYWSANMDMLNPSSGFDISSWNIKTNHHARGEVGDRPSAYIGNHATVANSFISRGCIIEGTIENSILSPGVVVCKGARVVDSILFHDTNIGEDSLIRKCIIDKNVRIERSVVTGAGSLAPNRRYPKHLTSGITIIGKHAHIKENVTIGRHCIVTPDTVVAKNMRSGTTA
ncbi:NTP transferase domain-containing protein [candidate division WOR-3 bacterium]|nr:NTP transferase domain-containing protein [candidate division WOR-3 bacterium]